jgi:hypothetical protein
MTTHSHRDRNGFMMRRVLRIHWVFAAAVVLVVALGGGIAYAYWSTTGSGNGSAANDAMQTVTVAAFVGGDAPSATLIPGGSADVILRVSNPNAYSVQVYSVSANGPITADAAHAGCTTTGVTFTPPASPISPTVTVPANSTLLVHLPGAASMSTASSSSCQAASFHIPVTMTVRK